MAKGLVLLAVGYISTQLDLQAGKRALLLCGTHIALRLPGYQGVRGAMRGTAQAGRLAVTVTETEKKVKETIF